MTDFNRVILAAFLLISGGTEVLAQSVWTSTMPFAPLRDLRAAAWTGSLYVAVGDSGEILTSPNATDWTRRSSGTSANLKGVAWTGSLLVAVGHNAIRTSPDGITWTAQTAAGNLNAVVWAGTQLVAVGDGGAIRTSFDGITWTGRSSGTSLPLFAVAFSASSLQAVGGQRTSMSIYTSVTVNSPDGVTWTKSEFSTGGASVLYAVTWNGTSFRTQSVSITQGTGAALVFTGSQYFRTIAGGSVESSPNGLDPWTPRTGGGGNALIWTGSHLVGVGSNGSIATSPDGITWSARPTPAYRPRVVVSTGSQEVMVANGGRIFTSLDGMTWTLRTSTATGSDLRSAIWTGNQMVVVGLKGVVLTSPDGSTWTERVADTTVNLTKVTWGGGQFVAVGNRGADGVVLTSPDAVTWTIRTSTLNAFLNGVTWTGNQFVAVGSNGTIRTSPEGVAWATRTSGVTSNLNAVSWTENRIVAVGNDGLVLTSPEGIAWTQSNSGTVLPLRDMVWTGRQLVVSGDGGLILTSSNGAIWKTRPSGMDKSLDAITFNGSRFFVAASTGNSGSILRANEDVSVASAPVEPVPITPSQNAIGIPPTSTLTWSASAGAISYRVQVSTSPAFTTTLVNTVMTPDSLPVTLATNTSYYWRVMANGNDSTASYWSATVNFVTSSGALAVPTLISPGKDTMNAPLSNLLTWSTVGGATAYWVQASLNPAFSTTVLNDSAVSGTNRVLGGLTNNKAYYWRVRAKNSQGRGPWSATWGLATGSVTIPAAPVLEEPAAGASGVSPSLVLTWHPVSGATSYRLHASTDSAFNLVAYDVPVVGDTSLALGGLATNTVYYWRVHAEGAAAAGPFSPVRAFTTQAASPGAPIGVMAEAGNGQVTVSWSAPASNGGSAITGYAAKALQDTSKQCSPPNSITLTCVVTGLTNGTAYSFTVVAANSIGTGPASPTSLSVTPQMPPQITTPVRDTTAISGANVSFTVAATALGALSYQWRKGGVNVATGTGGTTATYSITGVTLGDTATYTVVVTSTLNGSTASTTTATGGALRVNAPPSITTQPVAAQNVVSGVPLTFSVVVAAGSGSSAGALTYQWRKGTTNLATDTRIASVTAATLTITDPIATDTGAYNVIITRTLNGTTTTTASTNSIVHSSVGILPGSLAFWVSGADKPYAFVLPAGATGTQQVTMSISDVWGRTIWTKAIRPKATQENEVIWNGRTSTGLKASAGMYLVRIAVVDAAGEGANFVRKGVTLKAK